MREGRSPSLDLEGVFNVLDCWFWFPGDRSDIEARGGFFVVSGEIEGRQADELAPFRAIDGLAGPSEAVIDPRSHLDETEHLALLGDDVELAHFGKNDISA